MSLSTNGYAHEFALPVGMIEACEAMDATHVADARGHLLHELFVLVLGMPDPPPQ
eukprot:CAMPEP_0172166770 /NCGR_PEP_ID=MMETSP1050-20130122/9184_1 /TAXON_ID=233186 /ORGANISM="Cryptomonas curvata, Strain CCAP979/52" /LENGTH=54 /DNA_ID=CAMNT_0012837453 /DNA_START=103 /DNA_END=267 /DNA_ORIENTATION=-